MNAAERQRRTVIAGTFLVLGALLAGCGKGGPARLPIEGSVVRADGEKIHGSITFVPAEGREGPAATTGVLDGAYRFDRENGPTAGPHRVMVHKMIAKGAAFSALKEDTSMEGVAGCALWLLSDLGRSTTGETVHVDAGFHMIGLPDEPEAEG